MKTFVKKAGPSLILAAGFALAFAGAARAADGGKHDSQASKDTPGFNELDKNDDGKLTRTEAAGNPALAKRFNEVDENHDGALTRFEYLKTMAAKDFNTLRAKTADVIEPDSKSSSSGGSSKK